MSEADKSFRTPLSRVRGHGSARSGTGHFIAQRATAVALVALAPWFALSAALSIDGYDDAVAFVREPLNAVGLIVLIAAGAWHMMIGMQVIVEDYITKSGARIVLSLLNTFVCIALVLAGAWALLLVNFGW